MTTRCVCGGRGAHAYVLADRSGKGSPDTWGQAAVDLFDDLEADRIVGEINYGGDMVEKVIRSVRAGISYKAVRATRGKLFELNRSSPYTSRAGYIMSARSVISSRSRRHGFPGKPAGRRTVSTLSSGRSPISD